MENILGKPLVSTLSGSITPPNGAPIPWEDTKRLSPPVSIDYPFPVNVKDDWVKKSTAEPSFRKAKKQGLIVMLPYSIGNSSTTFFNARVPYHDFLYERVGRFSVDCSTGNFVKDLQFRDMHLVYHEQGSFNYWHDYRKLPYYKAKVDFSAQIEHAKTNVLSKLNTSFDLLTQLAEGKDTIKSIVSLLNALRHPLLAFKKEKDDLYKAFHRGELKTYSHLLKRIADLWLTYRYSIGPMIMSIQDALKTLKLKDAVFHTERAFSNVDMSDFESNPIIKPSMYLHDTISGTIQIRAVGKDGYAVNTELVLADLIGFNLGVTLWEKISYSFVIDWAINVGDFLNAAVGTLFSLADQRVCCYSVKQTYSIETRLHWDLKGTQTFKGIALKECSGNVTIDPAYNEVREWTEVGSSIVRRDTIDSFDRVIFNEGDIALAWDLQLDWRRMLDALSLSLNQARKRFAALR